MTEPNKLPKKVWLEIKDLWSYEVEPQHHFREYAPYVPYEKLQEAEKRVRDLRDGVVMAISTLDHVAKYLESCGGEWEDPEPCAARHCRETIEALSTKSGEEGG